MSSVGPKPTLLTVVGARPQFVKLGPLSRALRQRFHEVLVHTGQHYGQAMSDSFFEELGLPAPDRHLGIAALSHGAMTGRMLEALEALIQQVQPALVLVVGDTNSTLAAALAAAKLQVPVAHVEAGLRSFDRQMPEEINRTLTDHVSTLLFCPTPTAVANLRREGLTRGVHRCGDVMLDALLQNLARARSLRRPRPRARSYYLATLHRQENVDAPERLTAILHALSRLGRPTLLPLHPRTRERLRKLGAEATGKLRLLPPVPYLEMLPLVAGARAVFTDSGGLQKEAFILGVPCVTLRDSTEWVETLVAGRNRLVGADPEQILAAGRDVERLAIRRKHPRIYGDGRAAEAISAVIAQFLASSPRARLRIDSPLAEG